MTTAAKQHVRYASDDWELPVEQPLLVKMARPWLKNPAVLLGLIIVLTFVIVGLAGPLVTP